MKNMLKIVSAATLTSMLVGCGGGGSSQPQLNQVEKAAAFVKSMNAYTTTETDYEQYYDSYCNCYTYGYVTHTVTKYSNQYAVAKGISKQAGYTVVMDTYSDKYFAISMEDGYTGYNSAKDHYDKETQNGQVYFNLTVDYTTGDYIDPRTGTKFKEITQLPMTISAQTIAADKAAILKALPLANVRKLGKMSEAAAEKAADAIVAAQLDGQLSIGKINQVMTDITGSSLTEAIAAAVQGEEAQNALLQRAVDKGVVDSPEAGRQLVESVLNSINAQ